LNLFAGQRVHLTHGAGGPENTGRVFETFHPDTSGGEVGAPGDGTVIRQQNTFVRAREWSDDRSNRRGTWRRIRHEGNFTEEQDQFGQDIGR
jgi:hypothetical protein